MNTAPACKPAKKPLILSKGTERLIRAINFYRFMGALDCAHLFYSPSSLTYVRSLLSSLSGGEDFKTAQYLYRFPLPNSSSGNAIKTYTLGSKGREYLETELGLPVEWYYRPHKVKHLSYSQVLHNLLLTRFLVAAHSWCAKEPNYGLAKTRISYELAKQPATVEVLKDGRTETLRVVPDAWMLFERLKNGKHERFMPVLLEIDRGMEYREKFKSHVRSRIELIRSGVYRKAFLTDAALIAYVTTGERPEYRETRRAAMCAWTMEVLAELQMENWSHIFHFTSVECDELYTSPLFDAPVWYRPDSPTPVSLFTP